MSNKLFSLINTQQVHTQGNTKIIPAEDFSSLLSAEEIVSETKKEAENYKIAIATDCELIKERAYIDGYADGYNDWAERLASLEEEINKVYQDIQKMVVPIALKAARKMVGTELELKPEAIMDIVLTNIKSVAQHKRVIIYVNKNEWEMIEKEKNRLKEQFEDLQSLSIRPREDIEPGGCVIETEIGIINAQLEHRWHVLEKAFEKLMKNTP